MPRIRSILSLILVLVTTLLVSCGSPQSTNVPTTYTTRKIAQLQVYVTPIQEARDQMNKLSDLIAQRRWVDVGSLFHGPLGQLRRETLDLSRSLLPKDQQKALDLSKELFRHFEQIDAAAKLRRSDLAEAQYREALRDFDAFLNLIPEAS